MELNYQDILVDVQAQAEGRFRIRIWPVPERNPYSEEPVLTLTLRREALQALVGQIQTALQ